MDVEPLLDNQILPSNNDLNVNYSNNSISTSSSIIDIAETCQEVPGPNLLTAMSESDPNKAQAETTGMSQSLRQSQSLTQSQSLPNVKRYSSYNAATIVNTNSIRLNSRSSGSQSLSNSLSSGSGGLGRSSSLQALRQNILQVTPAPITRDLLSYISEYRGINPCMKENITEDEEEVDLNDVNVNDESDDTRTLLEVEIDDAIKTYDIVVFHTADIYNADPTSSRSSNSNTIPENQNDDSNEQSSCFKKTFDDGSSKAKANSIQLLSILDSYLKDENRRRSDLNNDSSKPDPEVPPIPLLTLEQIPINLKTFHDIRGYLFSRIKKPRRLYDMKFPLLIVRGVYVGCGGEVIERILGNNSNGEVKEILEGAWKRKPSFSLNHYNTSPLIRWLPSLFKEKEENLNLFRVAHVENEGYPNWPWYSFQWCMYSHIVRAISFCHCVIFVLTLILIKVEVKDPRMIQILLSLLIYDTFMLVLFGASGPWSPSSMLSTTLLWKSRGKPTSGLPYKVLFFIYFALGINAVKKIGNNDNTHSVKFATILAALINSTFLAAFRF